jgi:hypothetical protein
LLCLSTETHVYDRGVQSRGKKAPLGSKGLCTTVKTIKEKEKKRKVLVEEEKRPEKKGRETTKPNYFG